MFLRSCPLCDLACAGANEVLWHVHNEHHCLTDEQQVKVEAVRAASDQLGPANFAELQSLVDDVAISLLLPTTPVGQMRDVDSAGLEHLARSAYHRMAQELHPAIIWKVMPRLGAALSVLEQSSMDRGLAVLVSSKRIAIFSLPTSPRARASVGRAFAMRELLDALQLFPRYRVLVIGGGRPRILEGWAGRLDEVRIGEQEVRQSGVPEAEACLAARVSQSTELPLVAVGPPGLLGTWRERSHHSSLLVGTVPSEHLDASAEALAGMAQPLVTLWRDAMTTVETASLGHAERAGLVKWGLEAAWSSLADGSAEHLWVRRDFASAAVWQGARWELCSAVTQRVQGHSDDVVEELLRAAWRVGANVSFVAKGVLPSEEPIGAQLAPSPRDRGGTRQADVIVDLRSQAQLAG
jgi:hypothetical protein